MLAVRGTWIVAVVWLGVFAGWMTRVVAPVREYMRERSAWGMEPFEVSARGAVIVLVLFAVGHAVPLVLGGRRAVPRFSLELGSARHYRESAEQRLVLVNAMAVMRARTERAALGGAIGIASALAIACVGFLFLRHTFHGPHQDPLEFLAYFYAATVTLLTHAPRLIRVGSGARTSLPSPRS